jgi:hypothetical protein
MVGSMADGLIEAILGAASDAIIATDACGRITFGAARIFGTASSPAKAGV